MAHLSLSPKFIKETWKLFRSRPIREIIFGKSVRLSPEEKKIKEWITSHPSEFKSINGRAGHFVKVDPVHKGVGAAYLLPNKLGDQKTESLIVLDEDTKITQGPDLWIYLASNENVKKDGLGEYLPLVLIKGNKGGQTYVVKKPIAELRKYTSVVIWCKQFAVLFTYAMLS